VRRYSDLEIESQRFGRQTGDPDVCITLLHDGILDVFSEQEIDLIEEGLHEDDVDHLDTYVTLERDAGSHEIAEVLRNNLLELAPSYGLPDLGVEIHRDPRPRAIFDPNRVEWGIGRRDVFLKKKCEKNRGLQSFLNRQQWIHGRNSGELVHRASKARFIVDQHAMAPRDPDSSHIQKAAQEKGLTPKSNGASIVTSANIHPGLMKAYCNAFEFGLKTRVHTDFLTATSEGAKGSLRLDQVLVDHRSLRFFIEAYDEAGLPYGVDDTYKLGSFSGGVHITSVDLLLAKRGVVFEDNKEAKGFWAFGGSLVRPKEALIQQESRIRAQGILLSLGAETGS
jgi:hypothetical protein